MTSPTPRFHFQPMHWGWAAIHPKPKGTVIFIGGAFFGSFPTLFYRGLLTDLFQQGYTVAALPFRFSFRHWSIALSLASYQEELIKEIAAAARHCGYATSPYTAKTNPPMSSKGLAADPWSDCIWIGHSLGCKYIALLELLSDLELQSLQLALSSCINGTLAKRLIASLESTNLTHQSLYNQPSILLDPVMTDLNDAVPIPPLQKLISRWIQVLPSRSETFCVIGGSRLFNLTSVVSFGSRLAETTFHQFRTLVGDRLRHLVELSVRKHLAVLGWKSCDPDILQSVRTCLEHHRAAMNR